MQPMLASSVESSWALHKISTLLNVLLRVFYPEQGLLRFKQQADHRLIVIRENGDGRVDARIRVNHLHQTRYREHEAFK